MNRVTAAVLLFNATNETHATQTQFKVDGNTLVLPDRAPFEFDSVFPCPKGSASDYNQLESAYTIAIRPQIERLASGCSATVLISAPRCFARSNLLTAYPPPNTSGLINFIGDGLFSSLKDVSLAEGRGADLRLTALELIGEAARDLNQDDPAVAKISIVPGAATNGLQPAPIAVAIDRPSRLVSVVKTALARQTKDEGSKFSGVILTLSAEFVVGGVPVSPVLKIVLLPPINTITKETPDARVLGLAALRAAIVELAAGHVTSSDHALLALLSDDMQGSTSICHVGLLPVQPTSSALAAADLLLAHRQVVTTPVPMDRPHATLLGRVGALLAVERERAAVGGDHTMAAAMEGQGRTIERLQDERKSVNDKLLDVDGRAKALHGEVEELQGRLVDSERERLRVSKKLLELRLTGTKMVEAAEKDKFDAQNKLLAVQNDSVELQKKFEEISAESAATGDKMAAVKAQRDDLASELATFKARCAKAEADLTEARDETDVLSLEVINGEAARVAAMKLATQAQSETEAQKSAVADVTERLRAVTREHRTLTDEVMELRRQMVEQQGEGDAAAVHARVVAEKRDAERQAKELAAKAAQYERGMTRATMAEKEARAELDELKKVAATLNEEYAAQTAASAGRVDDMAAALDRVVSTIHDDGRAAGGVDRLTADMYAQVRDIAAGQVRALDVRVAGLQHSVDLVTGQRDRLAEGLQQAVDLLEGAGLGAALNEAGPVATLDTFATEVKRLETDHRVAGLQLQVTELEAQRKSLAARVDAGADSARRAYLELEERYSGAVAELRALRSTIKEGGGGAEGLREENWRLRREVEDMRLRQRDGVGGQPGSPQAGRSRAGAGTRRVDTDLIQELQDWKVRAVMAEEQLEAMQATISQTAARHRNVVRSLESDIMALGGRGGLPSTLPTGRATPDRAVHSASSLPQVPSHAGSAPFRQRTPSRTSRQYTLSDGISIGSARSVASTASTVPSLGSGLSAIAGLYPVAG